MKWLIWSNEHSAWWMPDSHGYTATKNEAGRYLFEEAAQIVSGANRYVRANVPNETMCPDWNNDK